MDSSGRIMTQEQINQLTYDEQKDFIPLTEKEYTYVNTLSVPKRREWYKTKKSKYTPHQGTAEKARRLKRIQKEQS